MADPPHRRIPAPWLVAIVLALGPAVPAPAQAPPQHSVPARTRVGLALGGGGARGLAHIGVLEWLDEHRIPVDVIAGTSMGGLVGGIFATGLTPREIHDLVDSTDWPAVLAPDTPFLYKTFRRKEDARDFPSQLRFGLKGGLRLPRGLSPGEQIDLLLDRISAPFGSEADFDALPTPFRCVATDLRQADVVVFREGWLARALRATMAIPGVFSPVTDDGRVLVDGGVLNNVPADVVRQTGLADRIVAVDVGADLASEKRSDSILGVLDESLDVMMRSGARRALAAADLVLTPDLRGFLGSDFGRADELIQRGRAAAEAHATDLLPYALDDEAYRKWAAARQARRPTRRLVPSRIVVEGVSDAEARQVEKHLSAHVGRPLDENALGEALLELTGSWRYVSATYRFDELDGQPRLVVALRPPEHGPPFLLLGVDLQNTRSSSVSATLRGRMVLFDLVGRGSEGRVDFSIGSTMQAAAEAYRPLGHSGLFVAPRAFASRRDRSVFDNGTYVAEYRDEDAGASADIGFGTTRMFETRLGYTVDHVWRDAIIGEPGLPSAEGLQQYASVRVTFDGQTGPTIPEHGLFLKADLRKYFRVADISTGAATRAADPDNLWSGAVTVSWFSPVSRRGRIFLRGAGGTSFGDTTTINAFPLGGLLNLGAYYPNELRGSNFALANLGYFYEISRFAEGTLGRLYLGAWLDEGSAFEEASSARFHTNATAGFVLESPIGPAFVGASIGADGRYRIYFSLGPVLR